MSGLVDWLCGAIEGGEAAVRYEVVGVARTRLIFGSRPQPVLN